ncbi:MAG: hypothetical protein ACREJC_21090 [Tepidisphaeraceae bacterium]
MKHKGCSTSAYKQAFKEVSRAMGFSRKNRVPKHARRDLQIYARDLALRICKFEGR